MGRWLALAAVAASLAGCAASHISGPCERVVSVRTTCEAGGSQTQILLPPPSLE